MTIPTGRFVWFEYVTRDASKAQGFFGELFGWSTKSVPMPDGAYTMIAAPDGKTIGGYSAPPPGAPPASWLPFLQVQSAAEIAARARTLGGKVMKEPFKVGDFATMAVVLDPAGAALALWQPNKPEEPAAPAVGHFCWNELPSKDPAASVAFYTQLGGFSSSKMEMAGMGTYHVLEAGGKGQAGILQHPMPSAPQAWVPYVQVASADRTVERAKKLGTTVIVAPTDIPNVGRFAVLADPQGVPLGILQP
ncbi:MAG TPA: VOC family protein [Kofleriaceae bacterium]|nr:VOC family protein [Kofleriaceae bacterium]